VGRKLKILVFDFIDRTLLLLVGPHLPNPSFSTWWPYSRVFKGVNDCMVLHSLLANSSQVAEEGSNRVLEVKAADRTLNCQLMVVLPGAKDANI
jgi:hypothetical protein